MSIKNRLKITIMLRCHVDVIIKSIFTITRKSYCTERNTEQYNVIHQFNSPAIEAIEKYISIYIFYIYQMSLSSNGRCSCFDAIDHKRFTIMGLIELISES